MSHPDTLDAATRPTEEDFRRKLVDFSNAVHLIATAGPLDDTTALWQQKTDARDALHNMLLALIAQARAGGEDTAKVTRVELIDHRTQADGIRGRVVVANPCRVELSYQDGGRTLKVFVDAAARSPHPETPHA